jgi:hypothetical protein
MLSKNMRCEHCCFAATCFGLVAFMLTIVALEFSLDGATSQVRLLIAGAGIASLLMILLTAVAVRIDRDDPALSEGCEADLTGKGFSKTGIPGLAAAHAPTDVRGSSWRGVRTTRYGRRRHAFAALGSRRGASWARHSPQRFDV